MWRKVRFGTWNIKTIAGKEVELIQEMKRHKPEILGISEVKKKGNGMKKLQEGYTLQYSGIGMDSRLRKGIMVVINLDLEIKMSFIQVYTPTEDSNILEKEGFYVQLQRIVDKEIDNGHHILIGGDLNARLEQDKRIEHGSMGNHGVGNSFFSHKEVHKITYETEGRNARIIIDYFIYHYGTGNNIMDVEVIRGAELATDHRLLVIDTRSERPVKPKNKKFEVMKFKEFQNEEKEAVLEEWRRYYEEKFQNTEVGQEEEGIMFRPYEDVKTSDTEGDVQ
ncbi:hypothetical protein ANN_19381 [Periplaneta americana]|uniref:Endonuclease/exonuclease/phosphatase domain-containing protein n=1 Tax=Periplaneta americana TaxID=6978 RepID=A0ABQ8SAD7_PERAM|nr:hypothetical protein ANN_19381 [Periplaneta americana]